MSLQRLDRKEGQGNVLVVLLLTPCVPVFLGMTPFLLVTLALCRILIIFLLSLFSQLIWVVEVNLQVSHLVLAHPLQQPPT